MSLRDRIQKTSMIEVSQESFDESFKILIDIKKSISSADTEGFEPVFSLTKFYKTVNIFDTKEEKTNEVFSMFSNSNHFNKEKNSYQCPIVVE